MDSIHYFCKNVIEVSGLWEYFKRFFMEWNSFNNFARKPYKETPCQVLLSSNQRLQRCCFKKCEQTSESHNRLPWGHAQASLKRLNLRRHWKSIQNLHNRTNTNIWNNKNCHSKWHTPKKSCFVLSYTIADICIYIFLANDTCIIWVKGPVQRHSDLIFVCNTLYSHTSFCSIKCCY